MQNKIKKLVYVNCVSMFIVLLMGAIVTKTDSGRGCGDDWPLCNGKFIPAHTLESMIEYSHRFVTGIVGLILLATTIVVFKYVKRKDARDYVVLAAAFTIIQSLLGAAAVLWPQSPPVLALHFGISLVAFASTLMLAIVVRNWALQSTDDHPQNRSSVPKDHSISRAGVVLQRGIKLGIWGVMSYSLVVVYIGAFVRHTDSYGGCLGWPLCNGYVIPPLSGSTGIMFGHRVGALLFFILIVALYIGVIRRYRHASELVTFGRWAVLLTVAQIASGAFATLSVGHENWNLVASVLHTTIIAALFGVLSYLCVLTLKPRE